MADHFLSKIRVASGDFVEAGGSPVLAQYETLRTVLGERAGPEVVALFAEPLISRGNDAAPPTVSWYTGQAGEPRLLSAVSPAERDRAEQYLADHLRPLRALAEQPDSADLALGALTVYGQDDIVLVNDRPVITNWGLMPDGQGANAAARPAHFEQTLGKYLSLGAATAGPEPVSDRDPRPGVTPAAAAAVDATAPVAAAAGAPEAPPPAPQRVISPVAWVPLLILLLLAGAFLAWVLTPGSRLFHTGLTPPAVTEEATLQAARALNDSLRDRKAVLEAALDGAVCRPDGVLLLPDGRTPEGLLPPAVGVAPERKATAAPDALLPNSPARVVVPDTSTEAGEGSLLSLIEARTVLVLALSAEGKVNTGSGFAVGPGLIVTNQHVIAPSQVDGGRLLVTGGALSAPQQAEVIKSLGPLLETGSDFALLRIESTEVPPFALHLPPQSLKLTNVVAAGFPGDVLATDINYKALLTGDLNAVPGLTVTDGIINTEQQIGPATNALMHSAALSGGNSGGPLVDMCGRLIGVNTFVRKGQLQNRGFALTAGDLMAFLEGTPASPVVDSSDCEPVVVRAEAPAAPAPAADE